MRYTWEILRDAVLGWGENEGQLSEADIAQALARIDMMKDEPEVCDE